MKTTLKLEKTVLTPLSEDNLRETSAGSCSINPFAGAGDAIKGAWNDMMDGFDAGSHCKC